MAIVAHTNLSFSIVGNREDLIDTVYNASPTDVPFCAVAQPAHDAETIHEWQTSPFWPTKIDLK